MIFKIFINKLQTFSKNNIIISKFKMKNKIYNKLNKKKLLKMIYKKRNKNKKKFLLKFFKNIKIFNKYNKIYQK